MTPEQIAAGGSLTAAVPDVETLARAMVEADLDDIAEPDDILDSMPEARQMAERIIAEYRAILNDAARERPSALDGRAVHRAWRDGMLAQGREVAPERMAWETLTQQDRDLDDGIAARLTEPEATLDHIAWAQHARSEHEATHGEAEQCGAECIALGLAEFDYESPA